MKTYGWLPTVFSASNKNLIFTLKCYQHCFKGLKRNLGPCLYPSPHNLGPVGPSPIAPFLGIDGPSYPWNYGPSFSSAPTLGSVGLTSSSPTLGTMVLSISTTIMKLLVGPSLCTLPWKDDPSLCTYPWNCGPSLYTYPWNFGPSFCTHPIICRSHVLLT
jgi:hypothetical protein